MGLKQDLALAQNHLVYCRADLAYLRNVYAQSSQPQPHRGPVYNAERKFLNALDRMAGVQERIRLLEEKIACEFDYIAQRRCFPQLAVVRRVDYSALRRKVVDRYPVTLNYLAGKEAP